jgi:vitamin B12 transporter
MTRGFFKKICLIFACALPALASLAGPALAVPEEDLQTLGMFFEAKDLVVSATRSPKPLSQSAENITVITAAEIEMMGAHTLADVLNNVPGIQIDDRGSVGTAAAIFLQGATPMHILVLLDGVTLNFHDSSVADTGILPVQNIERVEILKGPGSSSWGSALGGVINVITKSPREEGKPGGTLSASIGERMTRESRGEVTGTADRLGYFLSAGHLASNGHQLNTGVDENNVYAKLRWDLPRQGGLLFTFGYMQGTRQEGAAVADDAAIRDSSHYLLSTLSLNYPLGDHTDLDLSFRGVKKVSDNIVNSLSSGDLIAATNAHETTFGGSAKLSWRGGMHSLAMGTDFDHIDSDTDLKIPIAGVSDKISLNSDKFGLFLIDTMNFDRLAVTPGIRYDRMNPVGDFFSPSLGIAWSLTDHTILRAYAARGYSLPLIIPDQRQEKVLTFQAGFETTRIPYLWLKNTFFRNQLSDVQAFDPLTRTFVLEKRLKQGVEVEAKSVPLFNTSLSAGYTFVDARNRESDDILQGIPRQIVKLGLHYDDQRSLKGSFLGRYVWWNSPPALNPKDSAVIWDLNLAKKVFSLRDTAAELFFSAHNIFNGAQYPDEIFKSTRRWMEGGIRINF